MAGAWKINKMLSMWLIFDAVNPVRQFKRGMLFDDSPEVDFPSYGPPPWDDLTETDAEPALMQYAPIAHRCASVCWPAQERMLTNHGYRKKYEVECEINEERFMDWMPGELREVSIESQRKRRGKAATATVSKKYKVPAPYDRVIAQLRAEDRHGDHNQGHEALRRQSYARRVLDEFAKEISSYKGSDVSFRSKVLTPILARQLAGVPDAYSPGVKVGVIPSSSWPSPEDEEPIKESEISVSIGDATDFYLGRDPTDITLIPDYRYNMLSIPEVMWHLAVVMGGITESSVEHHDLIWHHTEQYVMGYQGDEEREVEADATQSFTKADVAVVMCCGVKKFFEDDLNEVVCYVDFSNVRHLIIFHISRNLWRS